MMSRRKRSRPVNSSGNSKLPLLEVEAISKEMAGDYQELREKRIEENKQRMQQLGILDLSAKLNSHLVPKPKNKEPRSLKTQHLLPTEPQRRSSRLETRPPVSYREGPKKRTRRSQDVEIRLREGDKPEVYTEEDQKLLGDYNSPWALYVNSSGNSKLPLHEVEDIRKKMAGGYQELREKRIEENKQRMQQLGILDLSTKLNSHLVPKPKNKEPRSLKTQHLLPTELQRRSSRLETRPPVSYREEGPKKRTKRSQDVEIRLREGDKPEVYTEDDQKLLGDCNSPWELYVDGYDKNGKRIYDTEEGETCHQCRQKTLGLHTHCSKCGIVQGQFCGDCLYMRYGENVMEANQKGDWICPVCRGICNCSLCRKAKGWAPTGALYRKVIKLGFKSVAHYLIQSCRSQPSSEGLVIENAISVNDSGEHLDEDNLDDDDSYEDEEDKVVN